MLKKEEVGALFSSFTLTLDRMGFPIPAVGRIASEDNSPYRILISTIISLRTQDQTTYEASIRLLEKAKTIDELNALSEEEIRSLIKPCGFYIRKSKELKEIARIITTKYNSILPQDKDGLVSLPGVGTKTANLVMNLSFNKPYICVDCHVHEISTRLGWTNEKSPEETEKALEKILPVEYWIEINELFVRYGQAVCTPLSPKCSLCHYEKECPQIGVTTSR